MSLIVEDVMSYELSDCKTALLSEKIFTYFGLRLFRLRRYLTASPIAIASAWNIVEYRGRGWKSS